MEQVRAEDRSVAIPLVLIPDHSADPTPSNPSTSQTQECKLGRTAQKDPGCHDCVLVDSTNHAINRSDDDVAGDLDNADNDSDDGRIDEVEADDGTESHLIPNDEPQGWLLINPRFLPLAPNRGHTSQLLFVHGIVRDFHGHHTIHSSTPPSRSGFQTPDSMYPEPSTSGQRSSPESSMTLKPLCANQVSLLLHMGQHLSDAPLRLTPTPRFPRTLDFGLDGLAEPDDMEDDI